MKKKFADTLSKTVVRVAKLYGVLGCPWKYYQPKVPAKLKPTK